MLYLLTACQPPSTAHGLSRLLLLITDGHARSQGLGCVITCFLVGALSAINGTAASYAEEFPVLSVVGEANMLASFVMPQSGHIVSLVSGMSVGNEGARRPPLKSQK